MATPIMTKMFCGLIRNGRTAIPGSFRHTTYMDVGSADFAWNKKLSVHPWT